MVSVAHNTYRVTFVVHGCVFHSTLGAECVRGISADVLAMTNPAASGAGFYLLPEGAASK